MTIKDAIAIIKGHKIFAVGKYDWANAFDMAINALQAQEEYRWHNLIDDPTDTPDKYDSDWVLVQIVEDNGFVWIPKVAEYRSSKDDWYCEETNGWLKESDGMFKIAAWCKLPI